MEPRPRLTFRRNVLRPMRMCTGKSSFLSFYLIHTQRNCFVTLKFTMLVLVRVAMLCLQVLLKFCLRRKQKSRENVGKQK